MHLSDVEAGANLLFERKKPTSCGRDDLGSITDIFDAVMLGCCCLECTLKISIFHNIKENELIITCEVASHIVILRASCHSLQIVSCKDWESITRKLVDVGHTIQDISCFLDERIISKNLAPTI